MVRATTALQPQHHFFRKCWYFQGSGNIFREGGAYGVQRCFTNPLMRQNPIVQALFGEQMQPTVLSTVSAAIAYRDFEIVFALADSAIAVAS